MNTCEEMRKALGRRRMDREEERKNVKKWERSNKHIGREKRENC